MPLSHKTVWISFLFLALVAGRAEAQPVLFFEGEPSLEEVYREIGLLPKTRSTGGTKRALINPQSGDRFDNPGQPGKTITNERPSSSASSNAHEPIATAELPELLGGKWIAAMVEFEINRAVVKGSQFAMLDVVGQTLNNKPKLKVVVSGHADKSGGDRINRPLSKTRSLSVRDYLNQFHGISPDRMLIRAASADEPLEGLSEFHPRNRRVQFGYYE